MTPKNDVTHLPPVDWINAMATRLAHLHDADEAAVWVAIPDQWLLVTGEPCEQETPYHIALAAAVVRAVREGK